MKQTLGSLAALAATLLVSAAALAQTAPPPPGMAPPGMAPPATQPPPAVAPAPYAPPVAPAPYAPPPQPYAAPPPPTAPPLAGTAREEAEPDEHYEFFDPARAFQLPPPPPPPSPSVLLGTFFRVYDFVGGNVHGALPHLGVTLGGRGAAAMLGYVPSQGLFSLGVQGPRFRGVTLSDSSSMKVALLGPEIEGHVLTDFSDNGYMNVGGSVLGLGVSSCSVGKTGMAYFLQLRGPMIHGWLPFLIDGESDSNKTHASAFFSVGVGLEAGLVFF